MAAAIKIRPCRPGECAAILDIWQKSGSLPSLSDTVAALEQHLAQQPGLLLVAERGDSLAGTVMAGWDGWRGNIYRLAVLPEYRRQGIGRALVAEAENRLARLGAPRISIQVAREEETAIAFWEGLANDGYVYDERIIRYVKPLKDW